MSNWSVAPPRLCMADANGDRFSLQKMVDKAPGPTSYTPKAPIRHVSGSVVMHRLKCHRSHRSCFLSNGERVHHVASLPGPGSYAKEVMEVTLQATSAAPFRTRSPRFPPADCLMGSSAVGPGSYDCSHGFAAGSARTLTSSFAGSRSGTACARSRTGSRSSRVLNATRRVRTTLPGSWYDLIAPDTLDDEDIAHVAGGFIPRAPRHFNLNNLNSRTRREHDPDFDNPPPTKYATHCTAHR